jgi:hypothetical protein
MWLAATEIDLIQLIRDGGIVVETLLILWAILTRRLVPGWAYSDAVERESKWEKLALEGTTIARDSVETLKHAATEANR